MLKSGCPCLDQDGSRRISDRRVRDFSTLCSIHPLHNKLYAGDIFLANDFIVDCVRSILILPHQKQGKEGDYNSG